MKVTNSFDTDQANILSGLISGSIWDKRFAKGYQKTALVGYYYTLKSKSQQNLSAASRGQSYSVGQRALCLPQW